MVAGGEQALARPAPGQLRRDPAARARFQGIQLNINTTIPLNYLLKLNEKVKTLTEGKK